MNTIFRNIIILLAISAAMISTASAQIAPGTQLEGQMQAEFNGTITEVIVKKKKSGFRAEVQFEGNFASGMPFIGVGELQISADQSVAIGDEVRGRFRANTRGEITGRDENGVRFSATGEIFRGGWITRTQFGGTSKQGGTSIFRLEGTMCVMGSACGNDT